MHKKSFNQFLRESLPELPPDEITASVTPWKKFIYYILAGMVLDTITVPFDFLQTIFSFIGSIMIVIGFQALRNENRFFKIGWTFSLISFVTRIPVTISSTTLYQEYEPLRMLLVICAIISGLCFYSLYRCLVFGVKEINSKCGLTLNYNIERIILSCCAFLVFVLITPFEGIIINTLIMIAYLLLFWNVIKLINEINESGYSIRIAPIIFSGKTMISFSIILLAIGFTIGYNYFDTYRTTWTEWTVSYDDTELNMIKEHLVQIGFPSEIINDLKDRDILTCKNAKQVIIGKTESEKLDENIPEEFIYYNIAVELSDQKNHWKIFHYYEWTEAAKFYGTECFSLYPANRGNTQRWKITSGYSGHILYDKDGMTYMAPYKDINETSIYLPDENVYTGDSEIIAEFSYPSNVTRQRGYISYSALGTDFWSLTLNSWLTYIHQTSNFLYPVETAADHWNNRYVRDKNKDSFVIFQTSFHYNIKSSEQYE